MTPRLLVVVLCVLASHVAFASEDGSATASTDAAPEQPAREPDTTTLHEFRTPVDALTERFVGTASRAIRFDWRGSPAAFGVSASELLERNNFGSTRVGGIVRKSFEGVMVEGGVHYVFAWSTDSSYKLALTPYRQAGRPHRLELDLNVAFPVAEGVVTPFPDWMPPAEMVLSAAAGARYLIYFPTWGGAEPLDIARDLVSPQLSRRELERLEVDRLPGMELDPGRYGVLAGLVLDVYAQPGVFLSPRAMLGLPLFAPVTASRLGFWWELSFAVGWAL